MRLLSTVICLLFLSFVSNAQRFTGKALIWELSDNTDKRFTVYFGSKGRSFGTEPTSIVVTSRHTNKMYIEFSLEVTDLCGTTKTYKVSRTVKPGEKAGESTWFDGIDYDTKCEQRKKYADDFYSKIGSIKISIVKVTEYDEKGNRINNEQASDNNSTGSVNNNPSSYGSGADNSTTSVKKDNTIVYCNPLGFSVESGFACANVSWWIPTSTNMISGDSLLQFIQSPDFTLRWRKKGDLYWKDVSVSTNIRGLIPLRNLEPCTTYEAYMLRYCNKEKYTQTSVVEFKTVCQTPSVLTINSITKTSADVSYRIRSAMPCGLDGFTWVGVVEYKTGTGNWDELVCVRGEGCKLTALTPGTTYRVRVRFRYNNSKYSEYSNEVSFTTLK